MLDALLTTDATETKWDKLKEIIRRLPEREIVRLHGETRGLADGLARLNEQLAILPDHDRRAVQALMTGEIMEVVSNFHLAVIGLISTTRPAKTEAETNAAIQAFERDMQELASLYALPYP